MSEEEKQAIKIVNDYLLYSEINRTESDEACELVQLKIPKAMRKVLNLIEKQQKEIEEYKFSFKILESEYKNTQDMFQSRVENSISKDKIRKKIKELEEELSATDKDSLLVIHELENKIEVLKELLGD